MSVAAIEQLCLSGRVLQAVALLEALNARDIATELAARGWACYCDPQPRIRRASPLLKVPAEHRLLLGFTVYLLANLPEDLGRLRLNHEQQVLIPVALRLGLRPLLLDVDLGIADVTPDARALAARTNHLVASGWNVAELVSSHQEHVTLRDALLPPTYGLRDRTAVTLSGCVGLEHLTVGTAALSLYWLQDLDVTLLKGTRLTFLDVSYCQDVRIELDTVSVAGLRRLRLGTGLDVDSTRRLLGSVATAGRRLEHLDLRGAGISGLSCPVARGRRDAKALLAAALDALREQATVSPPTTGG